ncbi:hypothetical protein P23_0864 [Acinetobacter calcoaceticus]|nr:hypothetical protein P23_0864 [Acinetobacter calcoaceticus]
MVSTGSTNTISPSFRLSVSFLYSSSIFPEYCKIKKQKRLFTRSISSAFRTILFALFLMNAISVSPNKKHWTSPMNKLRVPSKSVSKFPQTFLIWCVQFNNASLTYWFIPYLSIHVPPRNIFFHCSSLSWLICNHVLLINKLCAKNSLSLEFF